jgi:hypothetical protein
VEEEKGILPDAMKGATASSNGPEMNDSANDLNTSAANPNWEMNRRKSFVDVRHGEVIRHSITMSRRIDAKDRMYHRPILTSDETGTLKSKWRTNLIKRKGVGKIGEIFGWRESTWEFFFKLNGVVPPYKPDSEDDCESPMFGRTSSAPASLPSGNTGKPPRPPTSKCSSSAKKTSAPPHTQGKDREIQAQEWVQPIPIYAKKNPRVIATANNELTSPSCSASNHIEQGLEKISHRRGVL